MLDGRIDVQGTPESLRTQGVLDDIAHDSSVQAQEEAPTASASVDPETQAVEGEEAEEAKTGNKRKPRKLVSDEHRETGSVKWSIYNSYLKAS
jgi:hypothetical protein